MPNPPKTHDIPQTDLSKDLTDQLRSVFEQTLVAENIPSNSRLLENFDHAYLPLANWIAAQHNTCPIIIGINGSQGSGKSTLSKLLSQLLDKGFGKKTITLSIDDLYKTRKQREEMSKTVHPLFKTRGVPGTHDVALGISVLSQLKQQKNLIRIPVFNKAHDDREPKKNWLAMDKKVDIILFEGWCVGAVKQSSSFIEQTINELEKSDDPDLIWRNHINQQLANEYQNLFSLIDKLVMLKIPDFNKVLEWRELQENKLRSDSESSTNNRTMSSNEIKRFIMHFERITRHSLSEMPNRADVILEVDDTHQISKTIFK